MVTLAPFTGISGLNRFENISQSEKKSLLNWDSVRGVEIH